MRKQRKINIFIILTSICLQISVLSFCFFSTRHRIYFHCVPPCIQSFFASRFIPYDFHVLQKSCLYLRLRSNISDLFHPLRPFSWYISANKTMTPFNSSGKQAILCMQAALNVENPHTLLKHDPSLAAPFHAVITFCMQVRQIIRIIMCNLCLLSCRWGDGNSTIETNNNMQNRISCEI